MLYRAAVAINLRISEVNSTPVVVSQMLQQEISGAHKLKPIGVRGQDHQEWSILGGYFWASFAKA